MQVCQAVIRKMDKLEERLEIIKLNQICVCVCIKYIYNNV